MKRFATISLCIASILLCATAPSWSQTPDQVKKQDAYWNNLDKRFPNLNKTREVGDIQKTKEITIPEWTITAPKEWEIPKGSKAVAQKKDGCQQRLIICSDTLFKFKESSLTEHAEGALRIVGPKIKELGAEHPVVIEGHTDAVGTDEYNQGLSDRRAERVRNWLLEKHYIDTNAVIKGFGKKKPVAENTTKDGKDNPAGRALNRRVEIVIDTCKSVVVADTKPGGTPVAAAADTTSPAPAVDAEEAVKNTKWLPSNDIYTPEELRERFKLIQQNPLNNPQLHFQMMVPTDWRAGELTSGPAEIAKDTRIQIPIVTLTPPIGDNVVIEARYQRVAAGVSAEEFLKLYARAVGSEILARQHASFNNKPAEDALLKFHTHLAGTVLTRLTVARRGDYMFMLACTAPEDEYEKWKRMFAAAAVSFDPLGNEPKPADK